MRPNLQFLGNGKLDFLCGVMSTFDDSDCPFENLFIGVSVSALVLYVYIHPEEIQINVAFSRLCQGILILL